MKPNESWVGKKVRALNGGAYAHHVGEIGTVVGYDTNSYSMHCRVRWDYDGRVVAMWAEDSSIELVEDDKSTLMPYDEIWKMLKPKMEKNGLVSHCYGICSGVACLYNPKDFQKAVALAYKMGYERAMKGRPFKYGEKKRKVEGHWEKVDPENLPKDGTRVRYARPDGVRHAYNLPVGTKGTLLKFMCDSVGFVDSNAHWFLMEGHEDCLDYWVEGDDAD